MLQCQRKLKSELANPLTPRWTYKYSFEILVMGKILNPYERRDHEPVGDRLQQA